MELLLGVELNIIDFNGKVDLPTRYIKEMDIVIASLHTPCIQPGTLEENTNALIKCCENPYIHIIGHPDDGSYELDMKRVVKAAKENGKVYRKYITIKGGVDWYLGGAELKYGGK